MEYQNILYEVRERICKITLNRPEKKNAISYAMRQELYDALKCAERDNEVRVIIIKGAGDVFSAGFDLTPNVNALHPEGGYVNPHLDKLTAQYQHSIIAGWWIIWDLLKPVIAQVHGYALAGGSELATMCDLLFIAEDAQMGYPPSRAISVGDTMYFPWNMHMKKAKELVLTGRPVTGREAVEIGWANYAIPADELEEATEAFAKKMATIPTDLEACLKKAINRTYEIKGMRVAMEVAADWSGLSLYRESADQFFNIAREQGLKAALDWRDGPWGDYRARPARPAEPK